MCKELELCRELALGVGESACSQLGEGNPQTPDVCSHVIAATATLEIDALGLKKKNVRSDFA